MPEIWPEKNARMLAHLQRLAQSFGEQMYVFRCIWPKRMNSAFSKPGIICKIRFCSPYLMALEPDDVVSAGHQILQPQLHTGVRLSPRARIEPDGLHRPEAQRVAAASRDLFYRQTALEELLPAVHAPMRLDFLRRHQSVIKPVVLFDIGQLT